MATEPAKAAAYPPRPMAGPWGLKISGIGAALPEKVLTNHDLTAWMDTSDEWIRERTGIGERRIGGSTSGLSTEAAQRAAARMAESTDFGGFFDLDELLEGLEGLVPTGEDRDPISEVEGTSAGAQSGLKIKIRRPGGSE